MEKRKREIYEKSLYHPTLNSSFISNIGSDNLWVLRIKSDIKHQ